MQRAAAVVQCAGKAMKHSINIYTDGACSGNQNKKNIGGWGAVLEYGDHQKELFGGEMNTTNNRMEMTALLAALQAIRKDGQQVWIFSDSAYLMDCFREKWYIGWQKNNWKTGKKTDVENRDLWQQLFAFFGRQDFRFYRVKGHVDLRKKDAGLRAVYEKFQEWNGASFTYEDFLYITEMNHRADALANKGIEQLREKREEARETP
jgi:ribonuclease HI